jgi:L-alanine-DL-glutamate epimerase-like enolase superfamily enzyme
MVEAMASPNEGGAEATVAGRVRRVTLRHERWPIDGVFRISRGAITSVGVVVATVEEGGVAGQGEGVPYRRYGETAEGVMAELALAARAVADGSGRQALQSALGPGAARNALDCALWDLEARRSGRPVWELAGLQPPAPVTTAFTLSLDSPDAMGARARANADRPLLKLKLGVGGEDLERLRAVRRGAPRARLVVDANEGWTRDDYVALAPRLAELGVEMIEQPLREGDDEALDGLARPVPICADESCHDRRSLAELRGRYDLVNIKLDKAGGLTEALALKAEAETAGFGIMVGMMVSTSLSVAPAMLIARGARVVDLDGPLLLARDRPGGMTYQGSTLSWKSGFWGER